MPPDVWPIEPALVGGPLERPAPGCVDAAGCPDRCPLEPVAGDPAVAPRWPPGGCAVPGNACPAGIGTKSSLVIGSLNFLRRKRWSTSTSMLGGYALANLR